MTTLLLSAASLSLAAVANSGSINDTIPAVASSSDRLSTLVAAVQAADLGGALSGDGPFTVFAPTNEAFERLDDGVIEGLLEEPGRGTLTRILTHHVVPGRLYARDLLEVDSVETLAGTELSLEGIRGRLLVEDSIVETADVDASNGVVHLIDRVLVPPTVVAPLQQLLTKAIDRGVPLYNSGDPEACCAVYATALDAVALGTGWNLSPMQAENVRRAIEDADAMVDAGSRAWAYRRIIDALMQSQQMTTSRPMSSGESARKVFTFDDRSELQDWRIVLDGVMGGLSTGNLSMTGDSMLFTGETSLRNNGGFSSIRCGVPADTFSDSDSIKLRVRGDGRTWIMGTRKSNSMGGDSYWYRFETVDGEWMDVVIPIREMQRHFFGQRAPGSISPEEVKAIEFYIYDKKAGPFSLEVDSIEGVQANA